MTICSNSLYARIAAFALMTSCAYACAAFGETTCGLQGDANGDGRVNSEDLNVVLGAYGSASAGADIDGDGLVDVNDLQLVLDRFGTLAIVNIDSPLDGATVDEPQIDVSGTVSWWDPSISLDELTVFVDGEVAALTENGNFFAPAIPLFSFGTPVRVRLSHGIECLAESLLTVVFETPTETSLILEPGEAAALLVEDQSDVLFGAGMSVPKGAYKSGQKISIDLGEEVASSLPAKYEPVGPFVLFNPIAEDFQGLLELSVPYDPAAADSGDGANPFTVLSLTDSGWDEHAPISVDDSALVVVVDDLARGPFVAVRPTPLSDDEILVVTEPGFATVYLNGEDLGLHTPAIVDAVTGDLNTVKIYLPGYNERYFAVTAGDLGTVIKQTLDVPGQDAPLIKLNSSLVDGMEVPAPVLLVSADVTGANGESVSGLPAIISVNGSDFLTQVESEKVEGFVPLLLGSNTIQVRVNSALGDTGVSPYVTVIRTSSPANGSDAGSPESPGASTKVKPPSTLGLVATPRAIPGASEGASSGPELQVTLTWNTDETDIDLHVFDPFGNHAWYGNQGGIPGGAIDVDDVDGFGPEIFTLPSAAPGTYRVAVDSYYLGDPIVPTSATLSVTIAGNQAFLGQYFFTDHDFNGTFGNPQGANPAAFWDAHTFDIGAIEILAIVTAEGGPPSSAVFTTMAGESDVAVAISAPAGVNPDDIRLDVVEVNEQYVVDTGGLSGTNITFTAEHEPLVSLTSPPQSQPLRYEIRARVEGTSLISPPVYLQQDVRSQIRQEYVDKKGLLGSGFALSIPPYDSILDASQFPMGTSMFFKFTEFANCSHWAGSLAIIDDADNIADTVRDAWGFEVRCTCGWRNPRANDMLANSVPNSLHQTGDAVDLNPSRVSGNWPAVCSISGNLITNYQDAQAALTKTAKQALDLTVYDVVFHANHLHVERDPSGPPNQ